MFCAVRVKNPVQEKIQNLVWNSLLDICDTNPSRRSEFVLRALNTHLSLFNPFPPVIITIVPDLPVSIRESPLIIILSSRRFLGCDSFSVGRSRHQVELAHCQPQINQPSDRTISDILFLLSFYVLMFLFSSSMPLPSCPTHPLSPHNNHKTQRSWRTIIQPAMQLFTLKYLILASSLPSLPLFSHVF